MNDAIVITGLGLHTACGNIEQTWQAVQHGQSGIAPIEAWPSDNWSYRYAGELKDYVPREMVGDRKLLKVLSRQDVIGLHALRQALADSEVLSYRDSLQEPTEFNNRSGIFIGSPGNKFFQQYDFLPLLAASQGDTKRFGEKLGETVHPMWLLRILPNNVLAYAGIQSGFKGVNQNITNHATSGAQALLEAYHALKRGVIDRALVTAYDVAVEPQGIAYYSKLGVLAKQAIKSFDQTRDGTILGEGAGAMVLETKASAKARGAKIYGELLGGAVANEAQGVFQMEHDGSGLQRVIKRALANTELTADVIGMITAHANGTQNSDSTEAAAIRHCFGDDQVPVTGFKWAVSHTLAATGLIEAVLTVKSLNAKQVPGIAGLRQLADDCQGIAVSAEQQALTHNTALMINRAFASINAAVVFKGCC